MSLRAVFLVSLLSPLLVLAQGTAVLTGIVTDASNGKPVPDVVVTATSPTLQGEQVVVTDKAGEYRIPQLPGGVYVLLLEMENYKRFSRGGIVLRLGQTVRVNVQLLPEKLSGTTEETIGKTPTIDIGSTSTGVSVGSDFIKNIVVVRPGGDGSRSRRSFESLAELAPGARGETYGVADGPSKVDGSSGDEANPFVIDGLSVNPPKTTGEAVPPSRGSRANAAPVKPTPLGSDWAARRSLAFVPPTGEAVTVYRAPEQTSLPNGQPFADMYFQGFGVNPTIDTEEERTSTFSIDVDTASYSLARSYLQRGSLPDENAVRVEEFVNSFDYGYTDDDGAPFSLYAEAFPSPSRRGYHVVHLGLKAREVSKAERKPSHLVFVIDVSGSMAIESRLGTVKQALRLLVNQLDARDRISIVVYGSTAHVVLSPTSAVMKGLILSSIDRLQAEGATNAQEGIELGYRLAAEHLVPGGINRVILCSDGVANNGVTDADGIWNRVKEAAAGGVTLSTVGFGMGNYNDVLMERLAQVGEGNYAYVDRLAEAERIFVRNLTGTLQVVGKDVKVQVEWNPDAVSRYRLLGYENRLLAKEQFADDRVDAGEAGAGHTVTALYEVKLKNPQLPLGTFRIRYKAPEGGASALVEKPLPPSSVRGRYADASGGTRLSLVAAAFAEKLRGSYWVRTLSWDALVALHEQLPQTIRARPEVAELGQLLRRARSLDRRKDRFEQLAPVATMDFDRPPRLK